MSRFRKVRFAGVLLPALIAGSVLPYLAAPELVLPALLLGLVLVRRHPRPAMLAGGLLGGALLASVALWSALSARLPAPVAVHDVLIRIDRCWLGAWSSRCLVAPLERSAVSADGAWYLRMPPDMMPEPASQWRVDASLEDWTQVRRPGQSSFSTWLLRHRVIATGEVTDALGSVPVGGTARVMGAWRRWLTAPDLPQPAQGVYGALLTGDRGELTTGFRERVARTQTQHLLALSGLHIGSVALWAYAGAGLFWRLRPSRCRLIWQRAMALIAMAVLLATALTSVSLARAFWMAALPGALWLARRRGSRARVLLTIGAGMVVADPLLWLDIGAWFSWWATLLLIMGLTVWQRWPVWARIAGIQAVLGVLLIPVQAGWALPIFLHGFWVNIVLVPWVTLVALPLAFLTAARIPFADDLFVLAIGFWDAVLAAADPPWAILPVFPPWIIWVLMLAGAVLLLVRSRLRTVVLALVVATGLTILAGASRTPQGTLQIDYRQGNAGNLLVLRHGDQRIPVLLPGASVRQGAPAARAVERESWHWPRGEWPAVVLPAADPGSLADRLGEQGVTVKQWLGPVVQTETTDSGSRYDVCGGQSLFLDAYQVTFIPGLRGPESEGCPVLVRGPGLDTPILVAGAMDAQSAHRLGRHPAVPDSAVWLGGPGNWSVQARLRRYIHLRQPECRGGDSAFGRYEVTAAGLSCPQYGHGLLPWLRI